MMIFAVGQRGDKMTREEAIDVIKHNYPSACFTDLCEAVEMALQALSAQPELTVGKWIGYNGDNPDWQRTDGSPVFLTCSECGATVINNFAAKWNYCCSCGADMRNWKG